MGAYWAASLADLMSSRLTLNMSKVGSDYERHLTSTSSLHIYLNVHRIMYAHTHTENDKDEIILF